MKYNVTGMSCAACSTRVEKAVNSLKGVDSCSVNLLTNSMVVEGTVKSEEVIDAVNKAGYGATLQGESVKQIKDIQPQSSKKNLVVSIIIVAILMYFSMGVNMLKLPLPPFFMGNYIAIAIIQMLLALIVMFINKKFFINGFKGLLKGNPNMDTLVSVGSGASFLYSLYLLFRMTLGENHIHNLYFESAAMILALISVGKLLEEYSKGKTTNAIKSLTELKPQTATVLIDGNEQIVSSDQLKIGDIFIVKPGESICADGVIINGNTFVDESMLTGESVPQEKKVYDNVYTATINKNGYIKCRVTKTGSDTVLSKIIQTVIDASGSKAPIQKTADKVAGVFVPVVIVIAIITGIIWFLLSKNFSVAFERAISVLVISCPCSLGLATPVAIMVGSGIGAKNGILFKTASGIEEAGRIKTVVLDKTGTITYGKPVVTDIVAMDDNLLKYAYSVEKMSEHPLALAIVDEAEKQNITAFKTDNFISYTGKGISCKIGESALYAGNKEFINVNLDKETELKAEELSMQGKTVLYFALGNRVLGLIAVADSVKEDSKTAIIQLKKKGYKIYMLTGDNEKTAEAIAENVGIDNVIAKVLPEDKANVINKLKQEGKVMMVGDGINDAPALTVADIGVAIGQGTDIAIDSADIVLMNSNLSDVVNTLHLSKKVLKNIKENLFWAFFYNCIGIPLAAGVFIGLLGWQLNPMIAAAAMSLSSICVVSNALRLNLINFKKENKSMIKVVKIGGMMCGHCEARVKKILESFTEVSEAVVDHKKGTAVLTLNTELSDEQIKKAVEDDGYTFG